MNLHIGLTEKGSKEAEKLDRPSAAAINIHASNSVVQLAGSNNVQTAQLSNVYQSQIISILDQIEHEIPRLGLESAKREQAIGILATQHHSIAPVGFDPVSRFDRDQRRRHHRTGVTKPGQEPMKAIAARPRFVAEPQPLPSSLKSLDHLAQHIGAIGKGAQLPNLSRTTSIGHRNGNRRLVHIQPNVADRMHLARLPCMRLCAGSPAQPSFLACRETGRSSALREHTV